MKISGLRTVTGFVKVGIYLALAFSILLLLYYIGSFIFLLTHAEDLGAAAAVNFYAMPELKEEIGPRLYDSQTGAVRFRLRDIYATFSWLNMPRPIIFVVFFHSFFLWVLLFVGIQQMANVFEDVARGKPFAPENAHRLRVIGICMSGGGIFKILYQIAMMILFLDDIIIPGARIPWLFLLKEEVNIGLIFGGFVVLAVSEVFRLGNQLQEEQELTV